MIVAVGFVIATMPTAVSEVSAARIAERPLTVMPFQVDELDALVQSWIGIDDCDVADASVSGVEIGAPVLSAQMAREASSPLAEREATHASLI
jgi:hypothetical protein